MERGQCTFYRSFADAIEALSDPLDRDAAYRAVTRYALDGIEPDLTKACEAVKVIWLLVKPTLDASRRKAESGSKGGATRGEDSGEDVASDDGSSKTKSAYTKSTSKIKSASNDGASKKEKEKEVEVEKEKEIEKEVEIEREGKGECEGENARLLALPPDVRTALTNWLAYKRERREAYKPQGLSALLTQTEKACKAHGAAAVADIIGTSMASGYRGIVFDRLARAAPQERTGNPFLQLLKEERDDTG